MLFIYIKNTLTHSHPLIYSHSIYSLIFIFSKPFHLHSQTPLKAPLSHFNSQNLITHYLKPIYHPPFLHISHSNSPPLTKSENPNLTLTLNHGTQNSKKCKREEQGW